MAGGDIRLITPRSSATRGSPFSAGVEWLVLEERFTFYGGAITFIPSVPSAVPTVADPASPVNGPLSADFRWAMLPNISDAPIQFTQGQAKVFEALWSFKGVEMDGGIAGLGLHLGEKFRLMRQRLNARCDGIAGGVIAGRDQKAEEIAEFVFRHDRAIRAGLQDKVQNARGVARGFLFPQKFLCIDKEFRPRGRVEGHHAEFVGGHAVQHMLGEIGVGVGDQRVALFHQPGQVFIRRAKDAAQHPHRQLGVHALA